MGMMEDIGAGIGLIIMAAIWIGCLVMNILIAKRKNRSAAFWVLLSVFFSWITLFINVFTDPKS